MVGFDAAEVRSLVQTLGGRLFVALEPLDMRKQVDGLAGAVRKEFTLVSVFCDLRTP